MSKLPELSPGSARIRGSGPGVADSTGGSWGNDFQQQRQRGGKHYPSPGSYPSPGRSKAATGTGWLLNGGYYESPRKRKGAPELPQLELPTRYLRALEIDGPPYLKSGSVVATYSKGSDGSKSGGVEVAKVVRTITKHDNGVELTDGVEVLVQRTNELQIVPSSWVIDISLAGNAKHQWLDKAQPNRLTDTLKHRAKEAKAAATETVREIYKEAPQRLGISGSDMPYQEQQQRTTGFHSRSSSKERSGSKERSVSRDTSANFADNTFAASTLGEMHEKLQRPSPRAPPPSDAKQFKNALIKRFGKLAEAWFEIDTNDNGKLEFNEFVAACRRIGFCGNFKKIWEDLSHADGTGGSIGPESLDPDLPHEFAALLEKKRLHHTPRRTSNIGSETFTNGFNHQRRCSAETLGEVHQLLSRPEARTGPPADMRAFKNALIKKYGKLEEAWDDIDINCDGVLHYNEFVAACRRIDFAGNLKKIFELLSGEEGTHGVLKAEILDPALPDAYAKLVKKRNLSKSPRPSPRGAKGNGQGETFANGFNHQRRCSAETLGEVHVLLARPEARSGPPADARTFKQALIKKFRKLDSAWDELDVNGNGVLEFSEFVQACRRIDFSGNLRRIFEELSGEEGITGSIKPEALDSELPAAVEKLLASKKATKEKFHDTNGFEHKRRCSAETLGEVHMLLQRSEARSGPPCNVKAFKNALIKKFMTLEQAWMEIDANADGMMQYFEFVQACRKIGFEGNLKKIFEELAGTEGNLGFIKPESLDPHLPEALANLHQRLAQGYHKSPRPQKSPRAIN